MVAQDFSGLGHAQKPGKPTKVLTIAGFGGAILLTIGCVVLFSVGRSGMPVELSNVDDDTFFSTGNGLSHVGDKELALADAAMKQHDLPRARRYAEHAAMAYKRADAHGRLAEAERVVGSLDSALKSAAKAKRARLAAVVERAKEESEDAARETQMEEERAKARQQHSRAKKAQESMQAKEPGMHQKLASSTPEPQPVPKVLDCGPLGGDCNTAQGGEYYAKSSTTASSSSGVKALTASGALEQAEQRLQAKHAVAECDACMQLWTAGSLNCVVDKCQSVPHLSVQSLAGADSSAQAHQSDEVLKTAMEGLDWRQLQLNNARAALFARFVGADSGETTSKLVLVSRFASEWVPPGSAPVKSWLTAQPVGASLHALGITEDMKGSVAIKSPTNAQETIVSAHQVRENEAGAEGLSFEQALAPLNEEQALLNKERQEVVAKMNGKHSFGDIHTHTPEVPALLQWPALPAGSSAHSAVSNSGSSGVVAAAPTVIVKPTFAAKGRQQELAMKPSTPLAAQIKTTASPSLKATNPTKSASAQAHQSIPASQEAAAVGKSAVGKHEDAVGGVSGNELRDYASAAAGQDLESWFDGLITRRVAVGHGRVMGGGQVHKPGKAQLRDMENQMITGGKGRADARPVASPEGVYKEPVVGNEFVHGKNTVDAANELSSYFDGLISKRVAIGRGRDATVRAAQPALSSAQTKGGSNNAAKQAVGSAQTLRSSSMSSKDAQVRTAASEGHGDVGGVKVPVVGNEMKSTPDSQASQELQAYFDSLISRKVAVATSKKELSSSHKGSNKAPAKGSVVGNELKHIPDATAARDLDSYFDDLIKHTEANRKKSRFTY